MRNLRTRRAAQNAVRVRTHNGGKRMQRIIERSTHLRTEMCLWWMRQKLYT